MPDFDPMNPKSPLVDALQGVEDALIAAGYDDFVIKTEHGAFEWRRHPPAALMTGDDDAARAIVERYAQAAQELADAIKTVQQHPLNHIAIRQLAVLLESYIDQSHEAHDDLAPIFARLDAGEQLQPTDVDALLSVAVDEERYLRTGKE